MIRTSVSKGPAIELRPVKSGAIEAIGHAGDTMRIRFRSGGTYDVDGISAADHQAFLDAPSKGRHFHQNFSGRKLKPVTE